MKKLLLIPVALSVLFLAGCNDRTQEQLENERALITMKLPEGCIFRDLGYYAGRPVNAVICQSTVSTNTTYNCGKNCTRTTTTVTPK
jgi:hypothetical protein